MKHVLIIAIGPVQDFIASARRCRDLWFGSWLLSELSKAIGLEMVDACELEALVFPGVVSDGDLRDEETSVANKIVVRVPDGMSPADLAERGRGALSRRLDQVCELAFRHIKDDIEGGPYFLKKTARLQVQDLIELLWASAPETASGGYSAARREAESLLAARSRTRLWDAVAWGGYVPKSSIDGLRESVIKEELYDRVRTGITSPEEIRKQYGVGVSERLCGVGLLKRHGVREGSRYAHRFMSTGHLAAWPLFERISALASDESVQQAWNSYIGTLQLLQVPMEELEALPRDRRHEVLGIYDGSVLFEGRVAELFEGVTDRNERSLRISTARKALVAFLQAIDVQTPVPYYAILVADGDRMGDAIERQSTFEEHKRLSQKLDEFARNAREVVEEKHHGELIYSGGDDVLAFVPLHRAVDCARELAASFETSMAPFASSESRPTLSVGLGISHFMDAMSQALDLARDAEKLAKKTRNALAVVVDKRSGPATKASGVWGTLDQDLRVFTKMHLADHVPDGAAYELRELGSLLAGVEGEKGEILKRLVDREAERILRRKQPAHGAEVAIAREHLDHLLARLEKEGIPAVADRLIIARLLAEAQAQATSPKGEAS